MSRYYFNVFDGYSSLDEEGSEFPDWPSARVAAVKFAGEIFKDNAQRVLSYPDWRIEVTDDSGLVLIRLDFCSIESPAVSSAVKP